MKKLYFFITLIIFSGTTVYAQKEGPIKILFLGNSYTYYNGIPSMISDMALRKGKPVVITQITRGGNLLEGYANSDFVIKTIKKTKFDYVVLQEQSTAPLFAAEKQTYPAIRKLDKMIRKSGGKTVLFMTWAREYADSLTTKMLPGKFYYEEFESFNSAQDSLASSYFKIGNEINAKVAPAGLVWKEILDIFPNLSLWRSDHSHPAEIGSVIAAYSIFATIFEESVEGTRAPVPVPNDLESNIGRITDQVISKYYPLSK